MDEGVSETRSREQTPGRWEAEEWRLIRTRESRLVFRGGMDLRLPFELFTE